MALLSLTNIEISIYNLVINLKIKALRISIKNQTFSRNTAIYFHDTKTTTKGKIPLKIIQFASRKRTHSMRKEVRKLKIVPRNITPLLRKWATCPCFRIPLWLANRVSFTCRSAPISMQKILILNSFCLYFIWSFVVFALVTARHTAHTVVWNVPYLQARWPKKT